MNAARGVVHLVNERALPIGKVVRVQYRERAIDLGERLGIGRSGGSERTRAFNVQRLAAPVSVHFDRGAAHERLRWIALQGNERSISELELDKPLRRSTGRVVDDHVVHGARQRLDSCGRWLCHRLRSVLGGAVCDGERR